MMEPYRLGSSWKGGGSAYGADWKPPKPEDERFLGQPGEIKTTYPYGYRIDTKIGPDGKAVMERHYTYYPNKKFHTDPHDHIVNWEFPYRGKPHLDPAINYWPKDYPSGAPEFKCYRRARVMTKYQKVPADKRLNFKTISDFKECVIRGGEPVFLWNGVKYGVCYLADGYCIARTDGECEMLCKTPDDILEYRVGGDRLRDIITEVEVTDRTL